MTGFMPKKVQFADMLLGYVLDKLGKIETANSLTIKDAKEDAEDRGGRFAETLDDYESVEGKDLEVEDVDGPADEGGISKPIKIKEIRDERTLETKIFGTQYEVIWDNKRKCYVKRRKATM